MNNKTKLVIISLVFPIICLIGLTIYKQIKIMTGKKIIIPIQGYDPRDLLSGHYLTYRVNYGNDNLCRAYNDDEVIYLCIKQLEENKVSSKVVGSVNDGDSTECDVIIKGKCQGRFVAGIERFYIPEEHSIKLDSIIRNGKGKLILKVDAFGIASIKDLLINDRSWKEYIN